MKDMFQTGLFLLLTCTVAAICLAFTEQVTAPRIKAQAELALLKAKKEVMPEAASFPVRLTLPFKDANGTIGTRTVDLAVNEQGKWVGTVQELAPKGYSGPISMVLGVKADGSFSGVSIQSMTETPGLGTKLKEDFMTRFYDLVKARGTSVRVKVKQDGGDVDGITAATVSSRAFCKGVHEGMELLKSSAPVIDAAVTSLPTGGAK